MKNLNNIQVEQQNTRIQEAKGIDPKVILSLLLKNWYWFVIIPIIGLFCARLYIGHTMPIFKTSATILINETKDRPVIENSALLEGLGLPGGMQNMQNQIMILKSRALTERTLKELPFEIEYYYKTIKNQLSIYPDTPIKVVSDKEIPLPRETEFSITFLGNNKFNIVSKGFPLQKTASFGENIEISGGSLRVECRNEEWVKMNSEKVLYFVYHSPLGLISSFNSRLSIELIGGGGTILKISMVGTNRARDADFINKLIECFQAMSLDRKNAEALRRIEFIDNQLIGISDSLLLTENKLQQFRSSNRIMDLSAQGQAIISQVTALENERARLSLEANYYDYLADYLDQNISGEVPIVPITMGITDPALTKLVNDLAELQRQLSTKSAGEMNPLQRNLEQRIRSTKDALLETLNGLRRANSLARSEIQDRINKVNTQASALPVTERQLLGIERQFSLNNELYTFLLETRAEQQMQKASNRADSEVIDPASVNYSSMISPNISKAYFLGLLAGFGIPFLAIFLNFLFNKKLREEEIKKMTSIPVVGYIPHCSEITNIAVLDYPNSNFAEAYRLLRSKLQFLIKEAAAPVILVTSSMPGDGKTFTSINLASVYSLLGKKTILLGFDLRKPKIFQDFNLKNEKGLSTWLIGQDKLHDIIQETSFENLSVISAGPIPPNPSELIALQKTKELFRLLKEHYDYIIIDSSPLGIVSDTVQLSSLADVCLVVVRPGKTLRNTFEITLNEINTDEIQGVSLVINDFQSTNKHYGYAGRYGYTNDTNRRKKNLFRTMKVK
jgi:tyrosine-protein kinase Etk/Wzc